MDIYAQPNRRQALLQTIAHADVMIASTLALETQLRAYPHRKITHTHIYCSTTEAEVQDASASDRRCGSVHGEPVAQARPGLHPAP